MPIDSIFQTLILAALVAEAMPVLLSVLNANRYEQEATSSVKPPHERIREMYVNEYGKEQHMCMSCGCGKPNDNHEDSRNITLNDLNDAAEAAGISPMQAAQNIMNACQQISERSAGTSAQESNYGQTQGFIQPKN